MASRGVSLTLSAVGSKHDGETRSELVEQMRLLAATFKLVAEPTGCLGLAGLRQLASTLKDKRVGVVISGGNVDLDRYAALLASS